MKLIPLLTFLLAFTVLKGMILEEAAGAPVFTFPTLDVPDFDFIDLSGGCGSFTDCIEYVGAVIQNVALGIIFLILLIINLLVYIFEVITLIVSINFSGFEGAPWYVNAILSTPIVGSLALIVFLVVRSGRAQDA